MPPRKKAIVDESGEVAAAGASKTSKSTVNDDFTADLINSLNKDIGHRVAYNLSSDQSPTHVKRWISTGSRQLDYIISNRKNGGLPEGRIIEIFGPPSIGKSHIATHIARSTQQMGGIVVYIDTENATNPENLQSLGVDISKRFVYVDTHCTEEVFDIAEKTILKAKAVSRNVPITIIWDSVAASSPKAELEGAYDKDTIGLQARVISKGMRKITGVIGDQSVLFVCLNQIRVKIGCVSPETMVTVRKSDAKKQKISKFFEDAGYDYREMETNRFYPISGWEILTHTPEGNDWRKVTHLVRKESCVPVIVKFNDDTISVSPEHRFWTHCGGTENWVEAIDLVEERSEVKLLHEGGEWVTATFEAGTQEVDILDMTVEGTESYFSEGVLSHNTMYGDPTAVPGGNAIPFHASVRIRLGAGQQIKTSGDDVIGINVSAKTIKNKVGPPFRSANFRIIFGKGIEEHEEIFDLLRETGKVTLDDGTVINVEGAGSWKYFNVATADGEVIVDKKFFKADFKDKVMRDPEAAPWFEMMLERVMVKSSVTAADIDIDPESYEDVRALADQLGESGLDVSPE